MCDDEKMEELIARRLDIERRLAIGMSKYCAEYRSVENYLKECVWQGVLNPRVAHDVLRVCTEHYIELGLDEFQKVLRDTVNNAAPIEALTARLSEEVVGVPKPERLVAEVLRAIGFDRVDQVVPDIFDPFKVNALEREMERIQREYDEKNRKSGETVDGA